MADAAIWLGVIALACWTVWRITEGPSQPTYEEDTTMATTHEPTIISSKPDPNGPTHLTVDWHGIPVIEGDTVLMQVDLFLQCVDTINAYNREHRE